ncbi:response regulator transcription factor [Belliella sp. R4-6]|uniref:Response regulator transcription factor n=1 Tax=Belliella alkalica TaxID=1730871 RepID=A0ABS9VD67_9BACT|nr:response regulator transcription factor [Belliella alkalica]MCH7414379.1 response regulator transcription factor [Belliella alkalica]
MKRNRILLIEDNVILAETIRELLLISGFDNVKTLPNGVEIEKVLNSFEPDLVLMDIKLQDEKDGIIVAKTIRSLKSTPIVFISSFNDKATIDRAKEVNPEAFILKPFSKETLNITIEIILNNHYSKSDRNLEIENQIDNDILYVRDRGWLKKINVYDIDFIKTEGSYTRIITKDKEFTLRSPIKDIISNLPSGIFIRVHKSYIINLKNIDAINSKELIIGNHKIPIGKNHYSELQNHITKINS